MKYIAPTLILSLTFLLTTNCRYADAGNKNTEAQKLNRDSLFIADSIEDLKLLRKADEAIAFCEENNFNKDYCLLINMHKHSGLTRFYVWDFNLNKSVDSGLVSHGCGPNPWGYDNSKTEPVFSNEFESHCSSTGKYRIGKRGYSNWGIHVNYAMHGLDSTNNNSFERLVCMHGWDMVGDTEPFPAGTPEGWGCAAVSNEFMKRLDVKLQDSKGSVLMWIFY